MQSMEESTGSTRRRCTAISLPRRAAQSWKAARTFYQAVRTAGQYRGEGKLTTWLCGIAKNVLRTYQRRHPPEEELDEGGGCSGHAG